MKARTSNTANKMQTSLIVLITLMISACGFHLRGQTPLPIILQKIFLTSESDMHDFDVALLTKLNKKNVTILDKGSSSTDDILELKILKISLSDNVLSTASDNDTTSISRTLKLTYFIRDNSGKSLYGPRTVSVNESIYNQDDSTDVVAARNAAVLKAMIDTLADNLVYDLAYAPL